MFSMFLKQERMRQLRISKETITIIINYGIVIYKLYKYLFKYYLALSLNN